MRRTHNNRRGNNQDGDTGGRRHPHHHGRDREGFGGPGFGPGGPGGRGFGAGGRGFGGPRGTGGRAGSGFRARKGDIRLAILSVLGDNPNNGYGLMQVIAEKSGGAWRPSPGSVYPTLAQLVDEDLIVATGDGENERRSAYRLTESGTAYVTEQAEAIAGAWGSATEEVQEVDPLTDAARKLFGVIRQIDSDGTADNRSQAAQQIDELRRSLYKMLAE